MSATGYLKFYNVAKTLVSSVQGALVVPFATGARVGIVPGSIAWDDCTCGALYASLGPVHLSDDFPNPLQLSENCSASWEVCEILMQVLRCAPVAATATQSLSPTMDDQDAAAQTLASDSWAMLAAVSDELCALRANDTIVDYLIGDAVPLGPEGGCMGTELTMLVGMPRG